MDEAPKEYEVGYGKPPKETQFMKGVSGNPDGRPKGSRTLTSIINEVGSMPVTIKEGNQTRTVALKEAVVIQMGTAAAKGDRHSRRDFLKMTASAEAEQEAQGSGQVLEERDEVVLRSLVKRLRASSFDSQVSTDTDRYPGEGDA